jgi:hypothetical protein
MNKYYNNEPLGIYNPSMITSPQSTAVSGISVAPDYTSYLAGLSQYVQPIYQARENRAIQDEAEAIAQKERDIARRQQSISTGIEVANLGMQNYKPIYSGGKALYGLGRDVYNSFKNPALIKNNMNIIDTVEPIQLTSLGTTTDALPYSGVNYYTGGMTGATAAAPSATYTAPLLEQEMATTIGGPASTTATTGASSTMGLVAPAIAAYSAAETYGALADKYNWNEKMHKYTGLGDDSWDFGGRVAAGAAIGSMLFPGVGTVAGAFVGGLVGALDFGISKGASKVGHAISKKWKDIF